MRPIPLWHLLGACALALCLIAGPALAQDAGATLSALYNQALAAEAQATAAVEAANTSFDANDKAAGCAGLQSARKTYGEARVAMESVRDLLRSSNDLTPDYQKLGLDWVNQNEPVVDEDMKEIDRVIDSNCGTSSAYSTASIDAQLNSATALINKGSAANADAREAFGADDLGRACDALEVARQNHSDGYNALSGARSMVQSDHALPAAVQRQYFDDIDNTLRDSAALATSMAELWRNRCSSR